VAQRNRGIYLIMILTILKISIWHDHLLPSIISNSGLDQRQCPGAHQSIYEFCWTIQVTQIQARAYLYRICRNGSTQELYGNSSDGRERNILENSGIDNNLKQSGKFFDNLVP
jgi:hypothetical protein